MLEFNVIRIWNLNFYPKESQWSMRNKHVCWAFNSTILYSHIYMYLCYQYGKLCSIIQIFIKKKKKLVLFRYCNRVCVMSDRFDVFLPVLGLPAPPRGGLPDRTYQQWGGGCPSPLSGRLVPRPPAQTESPPGMISI